MVEYWDVYDVHRQKQNRMIQRGKPVKEGDYHLVVHCCVFNTNGEMLIQQRQSFKEGWPDFWDITVGGSALVNETSQMAMSREMNEEIGYDHDFRGMRPCLTINFKDGFDDIYLLHADVLLESLHLQQEEVQAVKYASETEILKMLEAGTFVPYEPSFIQLLFALSKA